MAKARRKMRRALMKKMRKGSLTPGERRDLMELDREVNRANRQAAGVGGAGLAAALAIASKTGALGEGKDALGDFLDERAGVREERQGRRAIEKEEKLEAEERAEDEADLSRRAAAAERSEARDAEGREDMRGKANSGFDPYIEAVRNMDGSVAVGADNEPTPEQEEMSGREKRQAKKETDQNMQDYYDAILDARAQPDRERASNQKLDRGLERRGGYDPRTGEVVDSAKQRAADEEFDREFDESLPDAEVLARGQAMIDPALPNLSAYNRAWAERWGDSGIPLADQAGPRAEEGREMPDPDSPVMTRQGMDLDTMIRLSGRGGSEDDREAGQAASLSDYSPEEVEALIRYDLRQADGGTTPFLRKMRDRIRKKFR